MKGFIKRTAIVAIVVLVGLTVYYTMVIYQAHQYTVHTVLPREKAARYPLQIKSLTRRQLDILLKVEDPRFFQHGGVDLSTPGAGLTTITQCLVKQLYFEKFKPGLAKVKQTLIAAFVLDPLMPKEMQLRRLINTIYLGPEATGFEQAANAFFQKRFEELTEDEYMAVVAMIVAPNTFHVKRYPERNKERVARIKRLVNGEYKPKGLCDLYYGKLDKDIQKNLAPCSYFESYYD